jgi:hypothetical protein
VSSHAPSDTHRGIRGWLRRPWRLGPFFIADTRAAAGDTVDATIVTRRDLSYTLWPPLVVGDTPRIVVLVDSSMPGARDDLARELRRDGFAVCWNGDCSRVRGTRTPGTISATARALDRLVHALAADQRLAVEDVAVVAQGPAALAALRWAHDYAPRVRGLIVASHGLLRSSPAPRVMDDDGECAKRVVRDARAIGVPLLALTSDAANDPLARDAVREFLRDAFDIPQETAATR